MFPYNQLSLYDHLSILGVFVDIETPNIFKWEKKDVSGVVKTKCMYIRGVTINTLCLCYTDLITQRTSKLHPPIVTVLNIGMSEKLNDITITCECKPFSIAGARALQMVVTLNFYFKPRVNVLSTQLF